MYLKTRRAKEMIEEKHRHRFEVNSNYIQQLENNGLKFVGVDVEHGRMEIMELENHPYYVTVQFHPECLSRPIKPSPPFLGLILAAKDRLKSLLARGCKLSPQKPQSDYYDSDDDLDGLTVRHLNGTAPDTDSSSAYST